MIRCYRGAQEEPAEQHHNPGNSAAGRAGGETKDPHCIFLVCWRWCDALFLASSRPNHSQQAMEQIRMAPHFISAIMYCVLFCRRANRRANTSTSEPTVAQQQDSSEKDRGNCQ